MSKSFVISIFFKFSLDCVDRNHWHVWIYQHSILYRCLLALNGFLYLRLSFFQKKKFQFNFLVNIFLSDDFTDLWSWYEWIYLFKAKNINTRTMCETCSKSTINTRERRQWRRSGVFIVNFEQILTLFWCFNCLTLNK